MPKLPEGAERPTPDEQITRWVAGESVCPNTWDECCPDFSCCVPKLLAPVEIRQAFAAASPADRMKYLGGFLGAAFEAVAPDKKVHISGTSDPEDRS